MTGPDILGSLRVSDADREPYFQRLSKAAEENRISRDEHLCRVSSTADARTIAELERLVSDLPAVPEVPSVRSRWRQHRLDRARTAADARTALARARALEPGLRTYWPFLAGLTANILTYAIAVCAGLVTPVLIYETSPDFPHTRHHQLGVIRAWILGASVPFGIALLALAIYWSIYLYNASNNPFDN
jgi:Domain of unknown function (DUF1707)